MFGVVLKGALAAALFTNSGVNGCDAVAPLDAAGGVAVEPVPDVVTVAPAVDGVVSPATAFVEPDAVVLVLVVVAVQVLPPVPVQPPAVTLGPEVVLLAWGAVVPAVVVLLAVVEAVGLAPEAAWMRTCASAAVDARAIATDVTTYEGLSLRIEKPPCPVIESWIGVPQGGCRNP